MRLGNDRIESAAEQRCVHFIGDLFQSPAQHGKLLEGETPPRTGKNDQGNSEWLLPKVDPDGAPHCFVFQLFALDLPIALMPGAGKAELFAAMEGHVMAACVLSASYSGSDEEDLGDLEDDA